VLDRNRGHRKFRRIVGAALSSLLPGNGAAADTASEQTGAQSTSEQTGVDTPPTPGHTDGSASSDSP
jgi:hypothetical protein